MTLEAVAKFIGSPVTEIKILLDELLDKEVARVKRNGIVYSSRMERDEIKRRKNRENGRKGGNPALLNSSGNSGSENHHDNVGVKAKNQKLESESEESPKPPLAKPAVSGRLTVDSIIVREAQVGEKIIPLTLRECLEAEEAGDNKNPAYALPDKIRSAEVWGMAKGILRVHGLDEKAAGVVVGEMSKKHGLDADDVAKAAVIVWRAAPRSAKPYFVSVCERIANERRN